MKSVEQSADDSRSIDRAAAMIEDLIPIAVVVAAGCERCAESVVRRALRRGIPEALIERTLGIVSRVFSVECLVRAVGPEVVGRMRTSLQAAEKALRRALGPTEDQECCG